MSTGNTPGALNRAVSARPWVQFTDPDAGDAQVRYTAGDGALYVIVTKLPENGTLLQGGSADGNRPVVKLALDGQENAIPVIELQFS